MIINRRIEHIKDNQGYYLVYFAQRDGQEAEIGRTYWMGLYDYLGVENSYEIGLLAAFEFAYHPEVVILDS